MASKEAQEKTRSWEVVNKESPMTSFSVSIGQVDAAAAMGMEDGHHHSGEATQGGQDAGLHAAFPLQHALRSVLPVPAKKFLLGLLGAGSGICGRLVLQQGGTGEGGGVLVP